MINYSSQEKEEAMKVIASTIKNCEKMQRKFLEGTSQNTLLKNRLKALYISKLLISGEEGIETYAKEELIDGIKPIASIISKCKTGQIKHESDTLIYKRFQKIIEAMNIAELLINNELGKKE
jgi:hypothetical protein